MALCVYIKHDKFNLSWWMEGPHNDHYTTDNDDEKIGVIRQSYRCVCCVNVLSSLTK